MLGLAALVASIGLVDSLNPSTVAPALFLATHRTGARRVGAFIAGVVAVNLAGGLVLTFGPGQLLLAALPHPGRGATHRLELALGVAMLLLALGLWLQRRQVARRLQSSEPRVARSPALLGAAIAVVELPTAFPYFAVIAAIVSSDRSPLTQVTLLLFFNAAFVLPLCVIMGIRFVAGPAGNELLGRFHAAVERAAPLLIPLVLSLIGAALIIAGAVGVGRD